MDGNISVTIRMRLGQKEWDDLGDLAKLFYSNKNKMVVMAIRNLLHDKGYAQVRNRKVSKKTTTV
jgi:hypothetical protein